MELELAGRPDTCHQGQATCHQGQATCHQRQATCHQGQATRVTKATCHQREARWVACGYPMGGGKDEGGSAGMATTGYAQGVCYT